MNCRFVSSTADCIPCNAAAIDSLSLKQIGENIWAYVGLKFIPNTVSKWKHSFDMVYHKNLIDENLVILHLSDLCFVHCLHIGSSICFSAPYTVVWNDYLLIFWPKCHILLHKKLRIQFKWSNLLHCIIKLLTLSETLIHFSWKLLHFKAVHWWIFFNSDMWKKWGRYSYFKLLIMLEYWLCCFTCVENCK